MHPRVKETQLKQFRVAVVGGRQRSDKGFAFSQITFNLLILYSYLHVVVYSNIT